MTRAALRTAAALSAAALVISPSAWAIAPPSVDPAAAPPDGSTGPAVPMTQRTECVTTGVIPGTQPGAESADQKMLDYRAAWQFSRGEGQLVAVIDTGITPGPRLPAVEAGGDYVGNTDGLTDCDGRGTLVAGIIAGQPADGDAFAGVAPAARLLSIRLTSAAYAPAAPGRDPVAERALIDVTALARAIVRAADLGARVIVVPAAVCFPADAIAEQQALGSALRYAASDRDALVVAGGGDLGVSGRAGAGECAANPAGAAGDPADPRNWGGVTSVSVPSWWQPYVLSVGAVSPTGLPAPFTMPGPWIGIAAPGQGIVSVSNGPGGGLANGIPGPRDQWVPLDGTGYAAAYVSGVAALVRSRYPELSAAEVIRRLQSTAHGGTRDPSNVVGMGGVAPVPALTWESVPPAEGSVRAPTRIEGPQQPPAENRAPRIVALAGTAVLVLAVAAALMTRRRKEHRA